MNLPSMRLYQRCLMKKHKYSFTKKAIAVFLSAIIFILIIAGMIGIVYMVEYDYYNSTLTQVKKAMQTQMVYDKIDKVYDLFLYGEDPEEYFENTNFVFDITKNDTVLLSTYGGEDALCSEIREYRRAYFDRNEDGEIIEEVTEEYAITGYVVNRGTEDIFSGRLELVELLYSARYTLIVLEFLAVCAFVVLLIFLFCTAGYRNGEEKPQSGTLEKIPFDVFTALYGFLGVIGFIIVLSFSYGYDLLSYILFPVFLLLFYLFLLSYLISLTVRLRTGGLIKNMLLYRVFAWFFRKIGSFFANLPLIWKTVIFVGGILFIDFIALVSSYDTSSLIGYWLIKNIILVPIIFYIAVTLRRLEAGGKKIAKGDFTYQIDTSHMIGDFKEFGKSLNSISEGMSKAVDERMKSERMKTELITNVSHDIKTPLTSIINYVDLIEKEHIDNETLREYIAVLDRQAARLKKLIEDLVEASKASTGNLTVNMTECDVGVLLQQTVGEYDEKLEKAGLKAIVTCPEEPVKIMADGRYMWRVFDNLMNNICKYSQTGTRIYLGLEKANGNAVVTFKNISRIPLNISADELMERFVRGDSSRSTEGSGLGLSIARSLTELQNGTLSLSVDGDLFKATLIFKTI